MAKGDKNDDSAATEPIKAEPAKTVAATTVTPSAASAKQRGFPKQLMYVGPSITENGVIFTHGQLFSNGLPPEWHEKALVEPDFARLLVPIDRASKALTDLKDPNSVVSTAKNRVYAAHIEGSGKREGGK